MYRFRHHGLPLLLLLGFIIGLRFSLEFGLEWGARKMINRIEFQRNIRISFQEINSIGLRGARIHDLKIFSSELVLPQDTLFTATDLRISIRLLPLILGHFNIESFELNHSRLALLQYENHNNYSGLKRQSIPTESISATTLSERIHRIFALLFRVLPNHLHLRDLQIETLHKNIHVSIFCPNIEMHNHHFETVLMLDQDSIGSDHKHRNETWKVSGKWNKDRHRIQGRVWTNAQQDSLHLPYLDERFQAKLAFQDLSFDLNLNTLNPHSIEFNTTTTVRGLGIQYWRLAPQLIQPDLIETNLRGIVSDNRFELNEQSYIQINELKIHPKWTLEKRNQYHFRFELDEKDISVQSLQAAVPRGLFTQLDSIRAEGSFGYRFLLDVDMNNPDSLQLSAEVVHDQIRLLSYGNLNKLNSEFYYTAYLKGAPVRSFYVGESNPNFRRLSEISPILQQAVLHSEDGSFYVHKGFSEKALRIALAHDIKERRFAKGGSTLSMQLVKNVFLDRNKNLFRKGEEAILVWLIENKKITPKARMFEVYLNLIEWGPGIYGAEEAAEFYFGKSCAYLEPDEAIFLASIIPTPRWYASSFNLDGTLKENRYGHFRIVGAILSRNGTIPPMDMESYVPQVHLKGAAKYGLKTSEASDSTVIRETI